MKFYVNHFGCRCNQAEIQDWITDLEVRGYSLTSDLEEAEFGILNTCSVTGKAEKDVFRYLNRVYRKTNIPWYVAGCSVNNSLEALREKYCNYTFLTNEEKEHIVEKISEDFPPLEEDLIFHSAYRSRLFLKIHDGCNFRCAYCIVPFLRGKSRSVPIDQVVEKARYYVSIGYREIVLTGINLSSYGFDIFPRNNNLLELIKELNKIEGLEFIRLSSLDPRYLKYTFVKEIAKIDKVVPSFHFSFQSGSNTVLKRMKRGSKVEDYKQILEMFRKFYPEANFGTDFIFGFPEETEKEFQETLAFIKESTLNYMHIFTYSPREGTKAALMEQLPHDIIHKRAAEVKEINREFRTAYREKFIGRELEGILIEENPNYSMVVTSNFISVKIPPVRGMKKQKVRVLLKKAVNDNICEGELVQGEK